MFVLAPLSNHLRAIRGGVPVEDFESSYDDLERPFGAIGLAAAAVRTLYVITLTMILNARS